MSRAGVINLHFVVVGKQTLKSNHISVTIKKYYLLSTKNQPYKQFYVCRDFNYFSVMESFFARLCLYY
jgi:hypothetical protein